MYRLTTGDPANNTRRRPRLPPASVLRLPGYGLRATHTFPHMLQQDGVTQRSNWAHNGATPWMREVCDVCGDGPVRASFQHQMPLSARTAVLCCAWAEELRGESTGYASLMENGTPWIGAILVAKAVSEVEYAEEADIAFFSGIIGAYAACLVATCWECGNGELRDAREGDSCGRRGQDCPQKAVSDGSGGSHMSGRVGSGSGVGVVGRRRGSLWVSVLSL